MQSTFSVVVPAAGIGKRMNADKPKQYLPLNNQTVLQATLARLISHPKISHIYLVLHPQDKYFQHTPLCDAAWLTVIVGGDERVDSVRNGLAHVTTPWVMVHDAARPCVSHSDIDNLLKQLDSDCGGILAHRVRDTMKLSNVGNQVVKTVEREQLWHALTPQLFATAQLQQAIDQGLEHNAAITDEASAMELAGHKVTLVEGSSTNLKITTAEDLALAEFYLTQQRESN